MKYGQRLGKYSVPEWHSHNILYDDLKQQIKELTSSPAAFSKKDYETLLDFFVNEIENTNLFVHCKLGEIEYRFQQCDYLVRDLSHAPNDERMYLQLGAEVSKLNQQIRNLSRFIGAQYTGFRKLLKKYRRHAPREEVANSRNLDQVDELLMARDSFARVDLTPQFLELSILYSTLRTRRFGELSSTSRHSHQSQRISPDAEEEKLVKQLARFDVEMLTVLSSDVYRFWVHPDNIVQLKVLLLQNMDLVASPDTEDEHECTSVMYMDTGDLQSARELGEPAQVRQVELNGGSLRSRPILLVPAGGLRHTAAAELSDEQLEALRSGLYNAPCITSASPSNANVGAQLALGWVSSQSASPVTSLRSRRTRFKSEDDLVWASIDTSTTITRPLGGMCNAGESNTGESSIGEGEIFPFAVLEVRVKKETLWVDSLRQSHLLYPVSSSFSLYAWALLRTHPHQVLTRPGWLDKLDAGDDIRKEPSEPSLNYRLQSRKSVASLQLQSHESSTSPTDNRMYAEPGNEQPQMTRYWNEFDDGDEYDSREDGFFEEIDEELRRSRIAASLARPVYQLGESMRRWLDTKKSTTTTSDSENLYSPSVVSDGSTALEDSSLLRHERNRRYSPRISHSYGAITADDEQRLDYKEAAAKYRNDQGLALITFLCFCLSFSIIVLVFTILFTEDTLMLPSGLRASLILFLIIALALTMLGYVAYNFRSTQGWTSQVVVHVVLLTVVCFGVGGIANVALPQL